MEHPARQLPEAAADPGSQGPQPAKQGMRYRVAAKLQQVRKAVGRSKASQPAGAVTEPGYMAQVAPSSKPLEPVDQLQARQQMQQHGKENSRQQRTGQQQQQTVQKEKRPAQQRLQGLKQSITQQMQRSKAAASKVIREAALPAASPAAVHVGPGCVYVF